MFLADGFSAIYPCHVPPQAMRTHPIGTGPFKFVEFKPNEIIRLTRNPDYWKSDRPYIDGIEYAIIRNYVAVSPSVSLANLAFTRCSLAKRDQAPPRQAIMGPGPLLAICR